MIAYVTGILNHLEGIPNMVIHLRDDLQTLGNSPDPLAFRKKHQEAGN